jgi:hypothetical protein
MIKMYLIRKTRALLRHHKKACILGVSVCLLLSYWYWYGEGEVAQTGRPDWVEGRRELYRQVWREVLHREGNYTVQGCTLPRLEPWGLEVKQFVSSIPQVRFSSLLSSLFNVL